MIFYTNQILPILRIDGSKKRNFGIKSKEKKEKIAKEAAPRR